MSFSEIRLPNLVLIDLYKKALIDIPENKQKSTKNGISDQTVSSTPPPYLGTNLKNSLILVNYPDEQFLPVEQLDFLSTILKACTLSIEDIAIVNTATLMENLDHCIKTLDPKTILFFGTHPFSVRGSSVLIDFNITEIEGILMVGSPSLENLNQNNNESKLLKRKLWDCLKQLFKI